MANFITDPTATFFPSASWRGDQGKVNLNDVPSTPPDAASYYWTGPDANFISGALKDLRTAAIDYYALSGTLSGVNSSVISSLSSTIFAVDVRLSGVDVRLSGVDVNLSGVSSSLVAVSSTLLAVDQDLSATIASVLDLSVSHVNLSSSFDAYVAYTSASLALIPAMSSTVAAVDLEMSATQGDVALLSASITADSATMKEFARVYFSTDDVSTINSSSIAFISSSFKMTGTNVLVTATAVESSGNQGPGVMWQVDNNRVMHVGTDEVSIWPAGGAGGANSRTLMKLYGTRLDDPTPGVAGDGARVRFYSNNDAGVPFFMAMIESHVEDPVSGSEAGAISFHVARSGTEAFEGPAFRVTPFGSEWITNHNGDRLFQIDHGGTASLSATVLRAPSGSLILDAALGIQLTGTNRVISNVSPGAVNGDVVTFEQLAPYVPGNATSSFDFIFLSGVDGDTSAFGRAHVDLSSSGGAGLRVQASGSIARLTTLGSYALEISSSVGVRISGGLGLDVTGGKITSLGSGTAAGDAVNFGQLSVLSASVSGNAASIATVSSTLGAVSSSLSGVLNSSSLAPQMIYMRSANNTIWRLTIGNDGILSSSVA